MRKVMQRIQNVGQQAGLYIARSEKCQKAFQRVGEKMQKLN
ncbi:MAG: hypothetical protein ACYTHK_15575 [Planctomycetota bacterium]|jgi:hypothetical protein